MYRLYKDARQRIVMSRIFTLATLPLLRLKDTTEFTLTPLLEIRLMNDSRTIPTELKSALKSLYHQMRNGSQPIRLEIDQCSALRGLKDFVSWDNELTSVGISVNYRTLPYRDSPYWKHHALYSALYVGGLPDPNSHRRYRIVMEMRSEFLTLDSYRSNNFVPWVLDQTLRIRHSDDYLVSQPRLGADHLII